ncbi:MAG: hypothetical protein ACYC2K_00685 [Gemmatimonadales bacterium]
MSLSFAGVAALSGQAPERLPVAGTFTYQRLWHDDLRPDRSRSWFRFMGRIAVPVHPDAWAGFAIGSWQRYNLPAVGCRGERVDCVDFVSAAVVPHLYTQIFPFGQRRALFVRSGAGAAMAEWFRPGVGGSYMERVWSSHLLLTAGLGFDIPLASSIYLTPAIDYSWLPLWRDGRDFGVIRRALAIGVGVSIR